MDSDLRTEANPHTKISSVEDYGVTDTCTHARTAGRTDSRLDRLTRDPTTVNRERHHKFIYDDDENIIVKCTYISIVNDES